MSENISFQRGSIVQINTTKERGNIQGGIRPAVIISNDCGNTFSNIITIVPLTRVMKKLKQPTHVVIKKGSSGLYHNSVAMYEQITTVNKVDVERLVGTVDSETMDKLNTAIRVALNV